MVEVTLKLDIETLPKFADYEFTGECRIAEPGEYFVPLHAVLTNTAFTLRQQNKTLFPVLIYKPKLDLSKFSYTIEDRTYSVTEIYNATLKEIQSVIPHEYTVSAFRAPRKGEVWLNRHGAIITDNDVNYYVTANDGSIRVKPRLILEKRRKDV